MHPRRLLICPSSWRDLDQRQLEISSTSSLIVSPRSGLAASMRSVTPASLASQIPLSLARRRAATSTGKRNSKLGAPPLLDPTHSRKRSAREPRLSWTCQAPPPLHTESAGPPHRRVMAMIESGRTIESQGMRVGRPNLFPLKEMYAGAGQLAGRGAWRKAGSAASA